MDFFVIAKFSVSGVIRLLFHERLFASVAVYTLSQLVLFPRAGSEDSMRVDKFKMVVLVLVVSSLVDVYKRQADYRCPMVLNSG